MATHVTIRIPVTLIGWVLAVMFSVTSLVIESYLITPDPGGMPGPTACGLMLAQLGLGVGVVICWVRLHHPSRPTNVIHDEPTNDGDE